jgi:hypothetical protein
MHIIMVHSFVVHSVLVAVVIVTMVFVAVVRVVNRRVLSAGNASCQESAYCNGSHQDFGECCHFISSCLNNKLLNASSIYQKGDEYQQFKHCI